MMETSHHEDENNIVDENNIIVEDYDDPDMEELLQVTAGTHGLTYDDEDRTDGDMYGGMSHELYNDIVEFKRNGTYPSTLNSRQDRSALSHWRARCTRYVMAQDNETLLYFNPSSAVSDAAKVCVKKGEVRRVIERVHELIGHLGQKRTQMAVLKKLHWRSVRQDVKTFVVNCDFCNQKKMEGKKILKAPVDISSENFGFTVKAISGNNVPEGERLEISLVGYNEEEVLAAASTRMTTYTFKETPTDMRSAKYGRTIKPEFLTPGSAPFRRQPYIRRMRMPGFNPSYMLPYTPKGPKEEPEFLIYNPSRPDTGYQTEEYEIVDNIVDEPRHHDQLHATDVLNDYNVGDITGDQRHMDDLQTPIFHQPSQKRGPQRTVGSRKRSRASRQVTGLAGRFSVSINEGSRIDIAHNSADLLTPLEAVQGRAELLGLAPIMMMPSTDPDIISLQKELLTRQLHIQELQEKVLQQHLDSVRIARHGEIDHQTDRIQLLEDNGENVIEELNVMDDEIGDKYGES